MNERAILLLLEEWHRQLCDAFSSACAASPDPEPQHVRQWKPSATPFFSTEALVRVMRAPTEQDPAEQWEWVVMPRTPPHMHELESVVDRIGQHVTILRGDTK